MGRGRARLAIAAVSGAFAVALLAAGCGPQSHANDPRPPTPVEITVNIASNELQVQPPSAGVNNAGTANLNQNDVKQPQANPKQPLTVHFTISNATNTDTSLEIRSPGGGNPRVSTPIVAQGNGTYQVALPTGHYIIDAADIPAAKSAPFTVGPLRTSSQQDLLLP